VSKKGGHAIFSQESNRGTWSHWGRKKGSGRWDRGVVRGSRDGQKRAQRVNGGKGWAGKRPVALVRKEKADNTEKSTGEVVKKWGKECRRNREKFAKNERVQMGFKPFPTEMGGEKTGAQIREKPKDGKGTTN